MKHRTLEYRVAPRVKYGKEEAITVRLRDGKRQPAMARPFTLPGTKTIHLHIHRGVEGSGWQVTEARTGYAIGNCHSTKQEAIEHAVRRIKKHGGVRVFHKLVKATLAKYVP